MPRVLAIALVAAVAGGSPLAPHIIIAAPMLDAYNCYPEYEAGGNQQRDFHDTRPMGSTMLIFGTVPNVTLTESRDWEVQADASIGAAPSALLPSGATNYRRWANFSWAVVERGGQTRAGDWRAAIAAGVEFIATDQYEQLAEVVR